MTRVLVLQGPNLNLLGTREPEIYGTQTLHDLQVEIQHWAVALGLEVVNFQSNHEGALIDRIHEHDFDAAIVNAGGLTHTSVALRDALLAVNRPFVEVHLTDPTKREDFRKVNFLADVAIDRIYGKGPDGAQLTREVGAEKARLRRPIRDPAREREVLLRISIANEGPTPQADLLAIYRRLIATARALEGRERERLLHDEPEPPGGAEPPVA